MSEGSNKWAITKEADGLVRVDFFDPNGKKLLTTATFDEPAIREFSVWLRAVVSTL